MWKYEGSKTLAYYLRRRDTTRALADDLGVSGRGGWNAATTCAIRGRARDFLVEACWACTRGLRRQRGNITVPRWACVAARPLSWPRVWLCLLPQVPEPVAVPTVMKHIFEGLAVRAGGGGGGGGSGGWGGAGRGKLTKRRRSSRS